MACGSAVVKEVISGDTVVIVGVPKGGPPPVKRITLSSLIAPRVAVKSQTKDIQDEPYGWPARESLRQRIIGQTVEFKIDYTLGDREYGTISINGENVSKKLLESGLVKLKPNKNPPCAPDYEELEAAQNIAKEKKAGLWCDDAGAGQATIRDFKSAINDSAVIREFATKHKTKKLKGVVEYVRDGNCMRIYFGDEKFYASVLIAGIQCDSFKREVDPEGNESIVPEPFAEECRFFVEYRLLNRDVDIRVEGCDDYGNLYGSVYHPNGNAAVLLLKNGFAKIQDWSAKMCESTQALREALKDAQQKRLRKWKNWQPPTMDTNRTYQAKVSEVLSADCLMLLLEDKTERRVYLASMKCPRPGNRNKPDEPWSNEAKELVRKKLVGKNVKVTLEYMREPLPSTSAAQLPPSSDEKGRMHFVSILFDGEKHDLAEFLIQNSLGKPMQHRADDERAENYDKLCDMEKAAEAQGKGMYGPENLAPVRRVNDLLGVANAQRARSFEEQLTRYPKLDGVVEFIFNAGRYKVRIPSQNLAISFCLGGLKCPQTARTNIPGQKTKAAEPFAEEALMYAREKLLQRDVHIHVDTCDRGGNFIGSLYINKADIGLELLGQGYACTWGFGLDQMSQKKEMLAAEQKAKDGRMKVWSVPGALDGDQERNVDREVDELFPAVIVSHINSIHDFFVQETNCEALKSVTHTLSTADSTQWDKISHAGMPRRGEVIVAQFTLDKNWYRARVETVDRNSEELTVLYIDFGNVETVQLEHVRRCPEEINAKKYPGAARACSLSGLLSPLDLSDEAAQYFHDLIDGVVMSCKVEKIENSRRVVVLTEKEESQTTHQGNTINEKLMKQGLARLDKKSATKIFSRLQKEEEGARKSHLNVWRYGDVGDDEDNDEADFPSLNGKRAPKK